MGFRASNEACVACSQACWAFKQTLVPSDQATGVLASPKGTVALGPFLGFSGFCQASSKISGRPHMRPELPWGQRSKSVTICITM